jgi:hypothetical protein
MDLHQEILVLYILILMNFDELKPGEDMYSLMMKAYP